MEKYITDPRTGLDYELVGDCYLIAGDDDPAPQPLGLWGRRRLAYLKDHRQSLYYTLLLSGKLEEHLHTIDADATDLAQRLTLLLVEQLLKNVIALCDGCIAEVLAQHTTHQFHL